jgi:hypothetical protein
MPAREARRSAPPPPLTAPGRCGRPAPAGRRGTLAAAGRGAGGDDGPGWLTSRGPGPSAAAGDPGVDRAGRAADPR